MTEDKMSRSGKDFQTETDESYARMFDGEIARLLKLSDECNNMGHYAWQEAINERLQEMAYAVTLENVSPHYLTCQWSILLGGGGPAYRVLVETDMDGAVDSAWYEYQDWFQPWTRATNQNNSLVERFASAFYFGTVRVEVDGGELS